MRHLLTIATIVVLGLSTAAAAAASTDSIDDLVATELSASGAPGAAYAVVTDGEISESGASGVRHAGTGEPVTPDTPFAIGSISKSFTALAVMQLVEDGLVDLDAPGGDYVTALAGTPAGEPTVRELLSHTSGFSTLQGNTSHEASGAASADDGALAQAVAQLADVAPEYPPGTRWEYSNTNYQYLGRLIEEVADTSFADHITAHVLDPVGMDDSFVADGEVHDEMATGHTPWFWTKRPLADNGTDVVTAPQGGIVASANDVAAYLAMMMNGEDDVLSAEGKAAMMRPASDVSPFYGLGWYVDTSDGTVGHSGATPGVETQATLIPARDDAVVVLVNGGSGIGFGETTQLRLSVTAEALGLDYAGEGSRWTQKALFLGLCLAPLLYLASMAWAWIKRGAIRAKSGAAGLFSLWFPLLTTGAAAWVLLVLVPDLMGAPLSTVRIFQPDMALAMTATAVMGIAWAGFRLVVAYTGRSAQD
ncbi:serine hydrolase domain-containing protein [Demequina mangrovi]|uniref:CubicO group peptidase, beta-lactamase class C family n=1 Tax=Demequina mangrovi TaxID=1043493 RepID=A0A1H6ZK78_9MICO|nr:serine hydrolase domain-containing protein [Demequina mangrovi]SEJ51947.1 CubicO group peptidase, beta-lactamase class C family [Demequina mangrovi]